MQDKLASALASPTLAPSSVGPEGVGQTSRPSCGSSCGVTAQNQGKFLNMQDKQAHVLASPSRAPRFGLDEFGPDAVHSGHPSSATLSGSSSTGPNLVSVETCSDAEADSSLPSGTSCGHSPGPKQSALVPQPFRVPLSSGVDSLCIPLPIKDAFGSAFYGEHGRASADPSLGTCKPSIDVWGETLSLVHYPDFNYDASCPLLDDDLGSNKDLWKLCIIGYINGKLLGSTTLNNLISSSWKCNAKLTMYDSGWLIYTFSFEADKLAVLSGSPDYVFG